MVASWAGRIVCLPCRGPADVCREKGEQQKSGKITAEDDRSSRTAPKREELLEGVRRMNRLPNKSTTTSTRLAECAVSYYRSLALPYRGMYFLFSAVRP